MTYETIEILIHFFLGSLYKILCKLSVMSVYSFIVIVKKNILKNVNVCCYCSGVCVYVLQMAKQ